MTNRSEWADFFDSYAPLYDDNCFTKNTKAEVDFIIDELKLVPGSSVLDVACGTGRHSAELASRGHKVTGVDISRGMLAIANERATNAGVKIDLIEANATTMKLNSRFDAVICLCEGAFGLLGTADDAIKQPLAILRNIADSMKPGAGCIFTVLNGCYMIRKHSNQDVQAEKFNPLTLSELSDCLPEYTGDMVMRERGFVPTELMLLFRLAGLDVTAIWGGTAGNWGRRPIDLDEIEIMVVARKPE